MLHYPLPIMEVIKIKEVTYDGMDNSWIGNSPKFPENKFYTL